jgi:type IV pilus assembly protein PilB
MSENAPDEWVRFLGEVGLFRHVKPEYLPAVARRLEERTFARDEVIFREGEPGETLFLIQSGVVGVFLTDPRLGLRFERARLRTGQVFGEMALLTQQGRSATCQALERTTCLALDRRTFLKIVERIPEVALSVAEVLAERVEQLNRERGREKEEVRLAELRFDPEVYRLVPGRILERAKVIPLHIKSGVLTVACVDPDDLAALDEVRRIVRGVELAPLKISEADYRAFVSKRVAAAPTDAKLARGRRLEAVTWLSVGDDPAAAKATDNRGDEIKALVDSLIAQAVELEASDIHIEPETEFVEVRYRVSGALMRRPGAPLPRAFGRAIASRLKVLADLDIAERRRPQDGRISCRVGDRSFDLRVSTLPTFWGEKLVLRILDNAAAVQPLERLVLAEKVCRVVQQMVTRPHGIVFVVGPTGSGKTTTLYSALGLRRREDTNITTVEDPVEYNLSGITQVNVRPELGVTFAAALRSILRQDPNVILVGETRDRETGKIALEASLTGHLVLTSLHTNDAIGTIQRLREMGLEDYAVAASLVGVISQRLVRRVCPACAEERPISPHHLEQLAMLEVFPREHQGSIRRGRGCEQCSGTGFRGRVGLFEILVADDELRQAIVAGMSTLELRSVALRGAFVPMSRYAAYLLSHGITTPEEVLGALAGTG